MSGLPRRPDLQVAMSAFLAWTSALPLTADDAERGPPRPDLTHSGSRGSPIRDTLPEGFSHFVTSMTAPVASGWSVGLVGLAPTEERRLTTAHTQSGS